jgi:ankyrin repeat protein
MTTRMTVQRLVRLIAAGDVDEVRTAVAENPRLLARAVERDGQGGWTPLHVAVAERQEKIVRLLVEAGADLSATTEQGRTPLHVALEQAPELVGVLRELGAPVDAASAAFLGDLDQLREELARGAHLSDPVTGLDLLAFAAAGGSVTTARLLLEHGADPDRGALHAAAAGAHVALVRTLLDAGADADRRDPESGRTPLHAAVTAGPDGDAAEIVRALLAAGADVNATTHDGASALDISRVAAARSRSADAGRATGNDALAELLVAHGATD